MKSSPFSRASAMFSAIAAAMALAPSMQKVALSQIGPYESRGKGGKAPSRRVGTKACQRAARKARNVRRHRAACKGGRA